MRRPERETSKMKAENGSDWYYIWITGKVYGFASARYIA